MQPSADNFEAAKLEAILRILLGAETDDELEEAKKQAAALAEMEEDDIGRNEPARFARGNFLTALQFDVPRVPAGQKIDGMHGGQWVMAQALAEFYAELFNDLAEAGSPVEDDQVEGATDELEPHGWTMDRDEEDLWEAVPVEDLEEEAVTFTRRGRAYQYGAKRMPAGQKMTIAGKTYKGGMFIPSKVMEQATPEQKEAIEEGEKKAEAKRQGEKESRKNRGAVDTEKLKSRLKEKAGESELTVGERKRARSSLRLLLQHHGGLAVHRLEELAGQVEETMDGLEEDSPVRERLARKMAMLHSMVDLAKEEGITGTGDETYTKTSAPKSPTKGKTYDVALADLHVDPKRFQYKLNTNAEGVTQELKSVETFNPDFAGVISVWRDPKDGKTYVVNGHHRTELARRLGHPSLAVRYLEEPDEKKARAMGALINIAEGRGTAVDAAKFLRDYEIPESSLKKYGVSLKGKLAQDAAILTKLNDRIFQQVTMGTFDLSRALSIAAHCPNPDLQDLVVSQIEKYEDRTGQKLSDRTVAEMSRQVASAPTTKTVERDLFGEHEKEESLFVPMMEMQGHIRAELAKIANDFAALSSERRAEATKGAGNVLNTEQNKTEAQKAEQVKNVFDTLVKYKGNVKDAIEQAAREYVSATSQKQRQGIRDKALKAVRSAVEQELDNPSLGQQTTPPTQESDDGTLLGYSGDAGSPEDQPPTGTADAGSDLDSVPGGPEPVTGGERDAPGLLPEALSSVPDAEGSGPDGAESPVVSQPAPTPAANAGGGSVEPSGLDWTHDGVDYSHAHPFLRDHKDKPELYQHLQEAMREPDAKVQQRIDDLQALYRTRPVQATRATWAEIQALETILWERGKAGKKYAGETESAPVETTPPITDPESSSPPDSLWQPATHLKIAADSPPQLRRQDVFRVLDQAPPEKRQEMAQYLQSERPDLHDEVNEVMGELGDETTPESPATPPDPRVSSALERYDNRGNLPQVSGALFGGDDVRSRERFDKLPDGVRVVLTEGDRRGQVGSIRRQAMLDGSTQTLFQPEGSEERFPVAHTAVEPLDPSQSWRTETGAQPNKQFDLFSGGEYVSRMPQRAPGAEEGAEPAPKEESKPDPAPNPTEQKLETFQVGDIGERSGTARKDFATKTGPRQNVMDKPPDERPGWARRYDVAQDVRTGKWFLKDSKKKSNRLLSRNLYSTKEEALQAVPLMEVARNHRVGNMHSPDGSMDLHKFAIYRQISDYKRAIVKDGFNSEKEAMQYMATHPEEIIEHSFEFPSEVPHLSHVQRTGKEYHKGNVDPQKFHKEFGFRGVEFGNWNKGKEGQQAINHAYDALHDLADLLHVPPDAISLNGKLILGFGSHGKGGKNAARAHYEPGSGVINLTKIEGAGTLAHEWFHALDHHIGKLAGWTDQPGEPAFGSANFSNRRKGVPKEVRQELTDAFRNVVNTIRHRETEVKVGRDKYEKHHQETVKDLEKELSDLDSLMDIYTKHKKRATLTGEDRKQWDDLKAKLMAGDVGEKVWVPGPSGNKWSMGRNSTTTIEALNNLYKKATGRSFVSSDYKNDRGARILNEIRNVKESKARLDQMGESAAETRRDNTDYYSEARKIDGHRTGDYWSTMEELAARAFESYVHDKIAERGDRSDYLVYGTKNNWMNSQLGKPYPEGEERKAINAAFDRLFQAMQHADFHDQYKPQQSSRSGQARRYLRLAESAEQFGDRASAAMLAKYKRQLGEELHGIITGKTPVQDPEPVTPAPEPPKEIPTGPQFKSESDYVGGTPTARKTEPSPINLPPEPTKAEPKPLNITTKNVTTKNGPRVIASWSYPSEAFWQAKKAGKLPPEVGVNKYKDVWQVTIWGHSDAQTREIARKLQDMGVVKFQRGKRALHYLKLATSALSYGDAHSAMIYRRQADNA